MSLSMRLVLVTAFLFIATLGTWATSHASSSIVGIGSYHSMHSREERTLARIKKQIRQECVVIRRAKLEKPIECLELRGRFIIQKICNVTCSSGENIFLDGGGNELNPASTYEM